MKDYCAERPLLAERRHFSTEPSKELQGGRRRQANVYLGIRWHVAHRTRSIPHEETLHLLQAQLGRFSYPHSDDENGR